MKNFEVNYDGSHIVVFNKALCEIFPHHLFDPIYLQNYDLLNQVQENIQGRGPVKFFRYNHINMVLRHYHRGGMPAKFIKDQYIWCGLQKTRAMCEIRVLSDLHQNKLPVPEPVAVHVNRNSIRYSADIITVCIPETQTLAEILLNHALSMQVWMNIGNTIKKFHNHYCNHADLNANNILLDKKSNIYLIDFDRSKIEAAAGVWQESNLQRLRRSLDKYAKNYSEFHFSEDDFSTLIQGYRAK